MMPLRHSVGSTHEACVRLAPTCKETFVSLLRTDTFRHSYRNYVTPLTYFFTSSKSNQLCRRNKFLLTATDSTGNEYFCTGTVSQAASVV